MKIAFNIQRYFLPASILEVVAGAGEMVTAYSMRAVVAAPGTR